MSKNLAIRGTSTHTIAPTVHHLMPVALDALFEHLRELPETQGWNLIRSAEGTRMLCDPDTGDCSIHAEIDGCVGNKINLGWSEGLAAFGEQRHLSFLVTSDKGELRFAAWGIAVAPHKLTEFLHKVLFPVPGN